MLRPQHKVTVPGTWPVKAEIAKRKVDTASPHHHGDAAVDVTTAVMKLFID
jgi:D-alanyl-D-alanine dipeptidase